MDNSIPVPPKKKNVWFGKIETKDEALKVIKDASNGFYFLAALQIVLGYFIIGAETIIDGIIFFIVFYRNSLYKGLCSHNSRTQINFKFY